MLDPLILRNEIEATAAALDVRGYSLDTAAYDALEARRKSLQMEVEALQSKRNASAKSIGNAKAQGEDIQPLLDAFDHEAGLVLFIEGGIDMYGCAVWAVSPKLLAHA